MRENRVGLSHLVTGATGNIGRRVATELVRRGERTRVFVRDRDKARGIFGDGVDARIGDLTDSASLSQALEGVTVLFLVTAGPDLAKVDQNAAEIARRAGVRTVVKLSTYDVGPGVGTGAWHQEGEAAIRNSGLGFTFVQPSGFMDNFLNWAASIRAQGVVSCCAGEGRIPFIHSDDIAAVVVEAMVNPDYVGRSLPITGPEALNFAEMTAIVGATIGRELSFQSISPAEDHRQQAAWGTPEPLIQARLGIFQAIRAGRLAGVTTTVASVLGREPISFGRWAEQNATAFVRQPAAD
ncbi:SDR family oxidoreductase [Mycobacterium vicinigordonae]|uniref:SDR family oxidoreductase n=1 Tax=Mycobacterium vicinigordonae TaxID=1719132 RepID=A0A7D6E923_9MYCO|nr:SDR family oxidoreductase [Mycobacterium vicinigordonae]QLL09343.1 SDR family oxidoreductase [Mycobacterium vicinigordonae]